MLGLLIIITLLAIGFAAGYGTRGLISRKRHSEYLKFQPYISAAPGPSHSSSDERARTRHAASQPSMAAKRRANHDITRTFQEISIQGWEPAKPTQPAGADLHLVQVDRPEAATGSLQPANVEQSLEELVALLQRRTQEN